MFEFRKKQKIKTGAYWFVFNESDEYEFAECSACGHEEEPNSPLLEISYPETCPHCKAKMAHYMVVS